MLPSGALGIVAGVPLNGFGSASGAGAPGSGGSDPKSGIGGIGGSAGKPTGAPRLDAGAAGWASSAAFTSSKAAVGDNTGLAKSTAPVATGSAIGGGVILGSKLGSGGNAFGSGAKTVSRSGWTSTP